jgi:adenylate kinase family enzyme
MRIIFISGEGHGAGKTYLAKKIASGINQIFSIANMIRQELESEYPKYDWYNKEPRYKTFTILDETQKSVHEMLIERGLERKKKNPTYWAKQLIDVIKYNTANNALDFIIIDDIRYFDEYEYIKRYFEKANITHFHVLNPHAKKEVQFDNNKLKECADYVLISKRVLRYRNLNLTKKEEAAE